MLDLKQVNDSQFIPISEEERLINEFKPSAFNSVKLWIENVTGKTFAYPNDFRKSLADGVLLCNLLNILKPGTIKRINKISTGLSGYEESPAIDNLGKFLRCCEDDFGLSPLILFEISDFEDLSEKSNYQLESEKRLERVLMCLFHLAKSVENHLTTFTIDSTPFQLLLKSQDIREMKKNKTSANNDDSVFESPVPELIQKQTPNYLANKAEQTLKQTKMNQEILQKSLENDDWQESLENWREKRRQVLSQSIVETSNNDVQNEDSNELIKLKEKARKMKQLRDQIKDQSIQAINDEGDCKSNSSIPDIDEEMKAMIERVKMKKLAEEQKRQFTLSSPIKSSFPSDSELSTSTALEKFEEDSLSISEKNENDHSLSYCDNQIVPNVTDNNILSNNETTKPDNIPNESETRIVQIKLIQRSKQDSDQLWGMDLVDKSGIILVSKVKIGSTSDVCDVRKGDEIISINSTNVTNQSIENVKSIFTKYGSALSPTEFIILSLKRIVNDDEDEDFLCSDISEKIEDNQHHPINRSELECNSKTHFNHNDVKSITRNFEQIDNLSIEPTNSEMYPIITKEIPKNPYQNADKNVVISETVERRRNNDEKSFSNSLNHISIIKPEIPRLIAKNTNETDNESQLSVQAKIAKFECQKISTPLNLNSSLNISKTPQNPEFPSNNTKFRQQSSCDGLLSLNQDDAVSKLADESHSGISNMYYYWETEAPKFLDSSSKNLLNKNAPYIQTPIYSLVNEKEKYDKFILEAAEQNLDTSNVNTVKTWKNGRSSCNSSTSDDVSALNDSINTPQYGAWEKSIEKTRENPATTNAKNDSSISITREFSPNAPVSTLSGNKFCSTDINYNPKSNISTGIQTNIQSRLQPVYTTITTAFESLSKNPGTNSISKISNEESYPVSSAKFTGNICNFTGTLIPSTEIGQPIVNPQMPWLPHNNNDLSKDFTLISSSITGKENQKNLSDTYSSRTIGSNVSGSLDENEKSIDVEVSVPPKLFPMRNKTLLPKLSNDKLLSHKTNEPNVKNRSFEEDETTLKSNYIKITDLDDVITPINQKANESVKTSIKTSPPKKGDGDYLDITKMETSPNQCATDNDSFDKHEINDFSDVLESNIDIEPTVSAISAPTLFKSNKNADNTISVGMTLSKSENYIPIKNESSSSDKKSRKSNSKTKELQIRKSSSTKDLRYSETDKSNTNHPDKSSRTSSNHRKHSPSQVTFSDVIQDITQTKTETKTFSIEKSIKLAPSLSKSDKKKSKSHNKKSSPAELSTKCNNCLQAAGSEDLMVIEELNLHFHLRCFTCSECRVQLGDGKSDTDVRIRRSKLHCATCYNKKSSKSKHRSNTANRHQQSLSNNISNKGGHGDGHNVYIAPGDSNNNCVFSSVITRVPSASIITFTNS